MNDFSFLFKLEQQLHSNEVRSDLSKMASLLSPHFYEFGASGKVWTREQTLECLHSEVGTRKIESRDFKATPFSEDVVLVTYTSVHAHEGDSPQEFLRSSIWRISSGQWQIEFHQGTLKSV